MGEEVRQLFSAGEIFEALDEYRTFVEEGGREWKLKDAIAVLHIDPSWFADPYTVSVIRMFLFYRSNPHQAYPVLFNEQPVQWVEAVTILTGIFPTL